MIRALTPYDKVFARLGITEDDLRKFHISGTSENQIYFMLDEYREPFYDFVGQRIEQGERFNPRLLTGLLNNKFIRELKFRSR